MTAKIQSVSSRRLMLLLSFVAVCATACQAAPVTGVAPRPTAQATIRASALATPTPTPTQLVPLSIEYMRVQSYPGSDLTIEQTLSPGANYTRYIASYRSEGLKIFGLLTVPRAARPARGWPVIIFNHGYIPPAQYRTNERYVAYVDGFARNGYIVFKPDYRGHGSSEGTASTGYGAPDYTIDVLNALATLKRYPQADPNRIGMWGHSMGGQMTLRSLVISKDIKAAVIWAGVVAPYADLLTKWPHPGGMSPPAARFSWRQSFVQTYGSPDANPQFWNSISPNTYVGDISAPIQLHHDTADAEVPLAFSQTLDRELMAAGKSVDFYTYPGNDHNLSLSFSLAMQRSIAFFNRYVKGV